MAAISSSYSVSLICLSVPLPGPHCLDDDSITESLEVWPVTPPIVFFPLSIKLALLGLLPLHVNFRISLLISTK